jgi:hypothetical protein
MQLRLDGCEKGAGLICVCPGWFAPPGNFFMELVMVATISDAVDVRTQPISL